VAITSISQALSKRLGHFPTEKVGFSMPSTVFYSYWAEDGYPPAGGYTSAAGGDALTYPLTGAFPIPQAGAGETLYIAGAKPAHVNNCMILYSDMLWRLAPTYLDLSLTTPQSVDSNAWPARDRNGSTDGDGVFIAAVVTTTLAAVTPVFTIEYTNSDGTPGRTGTTVMQSIPSAAAARHVSGFSLQGGDRGVRSIQDFSTNISVSPGAVALIAFRPVLMVGQMGQARANFGNQDMLGCGFPAIANGAVLFPIINAAGTTGNPSVTFEFCAG